MNDVKTARPSKISKNVFDYKIFIHPLQVCVKHTHSFWKATHEALYVLLGLISSLLRKTKQVLRRWSNHLLTSDRLELLRAMGQTQGRVGFRTAVGRDSCSVHRCHQRCVYIMFMWLFICFDVQDLQSPGTTVSGHNYCRTHRALHHCLQHWGDGENLQRLMGAQSSAARRKQALRSSITHFNHQTQLCI